MDAIQQMQARCAQPGYSTRFPVYFPDKRLVLVTTHRRENFGEGLKQIFAALQTLCTSHPELGFVFPVHLNPEVRKVVFGALDALPNLRLIEPVDFESNLYLQSQCALIITDSGGIQEEAPSFGVPTVVLREHTERGEGIAAGFATLAGTNTQAIINTAEKYLMNAAGLQSLKLKPNPYGDGLASQRIISALLGRQVEPFNG